MNREFVIFHISDLHLDGTGRYGTAIKSLISTMSQLMQEYQQRAPDRILLITGDLVEDPTPNAFAEAKKALTIFEKAGLFTDIRAIAGNHDVKRLGLFAAREDAYIELGLPKTSKSCYYPKSGLDLVLLDSNAASWAKGKINQDSYDEMVANSATIGANLRTQVESRSSDEYEEPVESIVRIIALHHHPLPRATVIVTCKG